MHSFRTAAIYWVDRSWRAAMAVGACSLLIALYVWEPAENGLFPTCPFHALTGLHCPGCGSLRAIHQLLHGNVGGAFQLNPMLLLALPVAAYAVASSLCPRLRMAWASRIASHSAGPPAILVAIVVYWVLRNLPFEPFSWLAPQTISPGIL